MNILGAYGDFKQERKIGEYTIYLPDPPNIRTIDNRDLPLTQQKWRRNVFNLKKFLALPKKDRMAFVKAEWERRNKGYWWFNGGQLEFATGTHWMYMEHWYLENTYPNFVDRDRDFFHLWKFGVEDDPNCTGMQVIAKRRDGKTHKGNIIVYDRTSRHRQAMGGIQSKTDADAKKVFNKMIRQWKRLPFYFKPVDEGDDHPKAALRFYAPKKIDRKGDQRFREYADALESEINFESVSDEAYDGTKLIAYFSDEYGKVSKGGNVHTRSQVTNECLVVGTNIIGKQIWTTTVEEMVKKGGANAKMVWDESDPNNLTNNGRTINSMKRLFVPASIGMEGNDPLDGKPFVNEFGYSNTTKAELYIQREYNSRKGETKRGFRRKYPLKITDAFLVESDGGHFDDDKIDDQLEYLTTWTGKLRHGSLEWSAGFGSKPYWKDGAQETSLFHSLILMDNEKYGASGQFAKNIDDEWVPMNTKNVVAGCDPFDHKNTAENKKSNAAAYFFIRFNPADPLNTGLIAMEYHGRRKTPNQFYEDMLKACLYFGCQINPENTKSGIITMFDEWGFGNFIMKRPDSTIDPNARGRGAETEGTPSNTTFVINAHLSSMIEYVDAYTKLIFFKELLEELLRFNVNDRTVYDRVMAFGYTLLAALAKKNFVHEENLLPAGDYFEEINNDYGGGLDYTSSSAWGEY